MFTKDGLKVLFAAACFAGELWHAGAVHGQTPFQVLVDRTDAIPGSSGLFNSFNAPAIDATGMVVFRGRGSGPQGSSGAQGIYTTTIANPANILKVADRSTIVPGSESGTFNSFPSFPRIENGRVIFRGVSEPVAPELEGNAGVYVGNSQGLSIAADRQSLVPPENLLLFDQYPGAPDITTISKLGRVDFVAVFKGNASVEVEPTAEDGTETTGIYIRNITRNGPIEMVADTMTPIPGSETLFGSTAPPSAQGNLVVFVGSDNEELPTVGGIYVADITAPDIPGSVRPLVELGDTIPNSGGAAFARFNETLSFDGKTVAFFGSDVVAPQLNPTALQGIYTVDVQTGLVKKIVDTNTNVPDLSEPFPSFLFESSPMGGEQEGVLKFPAFLAIEGENVAFLAHAPNDVVGIYLSQQGKIGPQTLRTVLDTTNDGGLLDPALAGVPVSELSVERDALRGNRLVFTATIGDEEEEVAASATADEEETEVDFQRGLYLHSVPSRSSVTVVNSDGTLSILGDNLSNGVLVVGVSNVPLVGQVVLVSPLPGTKMSGAGVYRLITGVQVALGGGDDALTMTGAFNLEEFLADGGTGKDRLRRATASLTATTLSILGFEIDDGLRSTK